MKGWLASEPNWLWGGPFFRGELPRAGAPGLCNKALRGVLQIPLYFAILSESCSQAGAFVLKKARQVQGDFLYR